jgi:hypothetical protein
MRRLALLLLLWTCAAMAAPPVYMVLWFDTEDYVLPAADDAALRIARDLTSLGVRATFKVVGEKARTLERRGRVDVIRALSQHDIGYHSNYHSGQPTPALYLNQLGWDEGVAEFARRESWGARDLERIFGVTPSCYGQPGSSWAPQSDPALRGMGIRVYLDEGSQVGIDNQPFWYGGLLHVFNMGPYSIRGSLEPKVPLAQSNKVLDDAAAALEKRGGGLISTYYHPTELVTTEFWDAVNYLHGATTEPENWKMPKQRTAEDAERCYNILRGYVEHALKRNVRFVTARDLPQIYAGLEPPKADPAAVRKHLLEGITFLNTPQGALSPADMLQLLLGLEPRVVDGPSVRKETNHSGPVTRAAFERAKRDAADFIRARHALPPMVWVGSDFLSLPDFTATLAGDDGSSQEVQVRRGRLEFERYFATNALRAFGWPIHPRGFAPAALLELARLEGWTLKPARLR